MTLYTWKTSQQDALLELLKKAAHNKKGAKITQLKKIEKETLGKVPWVNLTIVEGKVHFDLNSNSFGCLKIAHNVTFEFFNLAFPPLLVLLKVTCLITLFVVFDHKLQAFKKSP